MLNSCIYEGVIRHRRNTPHVHQFDFKSFFLMMDLAEIDSIFRRHWFWSADRFALGRFKESEHLIHHRQSGNLRQRVDQVLDDAGISPNTIGSIRLLTQLRFFGFSMNPVSFFYCYSLCGKNVRAVIAEVNNTPWGEQHVYVISSPETNPIPNSQTSIRSNAIDKDFHVSPFMSLDMSYQMSFTVPGKKLGVKIENHLDQPLNDVKKILDVSMLMKRKPFTGWNLNRLLVRYPLITLQIFASIYWQAFRLFLKKTTFHSHPRKRNSDTTHPDNSEDPQATTISGESTRPSPSKSKSVLVSR
jgi:uncharacterized protein